MLTKQELEIAARKLCELRGQNPEGLWTPRVLNREIAEIHLESFMSPREHSQFLSAIVYAINLRERVDL